MAERSTAPHGRRFPAAIISHGVWLYLRFPLSYRDVEELLAERGIEVSYESIRRWVAKLGPSLTIELRKREAKTGRTWHLDEMAVRIGGRQHWLWRAVDEHGATLDVLRQERRDTEAAERFLPLLLGHTGAAPERITTDKLGSYAAALQRLPELEGVDSPEGPLGAAMQQPSGASTSAYPCKRTQDGPLPMPCLSPAVPLGLRSHLQPVPSPPSPPHRP